MRPKLSKSSKRGSFKVDVRGKKTVNATALLTNKQREHLTPKKYLSRDNNVSKPKKEQVKTKMQIEKLKSDIVSSPLVLIDKRSANQNVKSTQITTEEAPVQKDDIEQTYSNNKNTKKIQFQCPYCSKLFRVYFSANKHIEKCPSASGHNLKGAIVGKPITVEMCDSCNVPIKPKEPHFCCLLNSSMYTCSGCNQQFISIKLFELHVMGMHSDELESMFFPTNDEFLDWKNQMETQTEVKYSVIVKYTTKQHYRCTHLPSEQNDKSISSLFCPATLITQEFSKGLQVHFYKQHFGHNFKKYTLPVKYKKYSITSLMKNAEGYVDITDVSGDKNDPYVQFKTLMESIVLDAAKIKVDTLRLLIGKALEMTSVLTNYVEDDDSDNRGNTSALIFASSDNSKANIEINKAIESLRSSERLKRKLSTEVVEKKNVKEPLKTNNKVIETNQGNIKTPLSHNLVSVSPVKQQVSGSESNVTNLDTTTNKKPRLTSKRLSLIDVSKQPAENIDENLTPKILNSYSIADVTDQKLRKALLDPDDDKKEKQDDVTSQDKVSVNKQNEQSKENQANFNYQVPTSFNDSYKEFVDKHIKVPVKHNPKNKSDKTPAPNITPHISKTEHKVGNMNKKIIESHNATLGKMENMSPRLQQTTELSDTSSQKRDKSPTLSKSINMVNNQQPESINTVLSETPEKTETMLISSLVGESENMLTPRLKKSAQKTLPDIPNNKKTKGKMEELIKNVSNVQRSSVKKITQDRLIRKKRILKTRIGQFIPNSSPKNVTSPEINISRNDLSKVKIDEYEVKEQENDCNILILKI